MKIIDIQFGDFHHICSRFSTSIVPSLLEMYEEISGSNRLL